MQFLISGYIPNRTVFTRNLQCLPEFSKCQSASDCCDRHSSCFVLHWEKDVYISTCVHELRVKAVEARPKGEPLEGMVGFCSKNGYGCRTHYNCCSRDCRDNTTCVAPRKGECIKHFAECKNERQCCSLKCEVTNRKRYLYVQIKYCRPVKVPKKCYKLKKPCINHIECCSRLCDYLPKKKTKKKKFCKKQKGMAIKTEQSTLLVLASYFLFILISVEIEGIEWPMAFYL